jgi:hypothetical protein
MRIGFLYDLLEHWNLPRLILITWIYTPTIQPPAPKTVFVVLRAVVSTR